MTELDKYLVAVVAAGLPHVEALDGAIGDDWYISGPIRLWHRDGWSPGYFQHPEDWATFVIDYTEAK